MITLIPGLVDVDIDENVEGACDMKCTSILQTLDFNLLETNPCMGRTNLKHHTPKLNFKL